MNKLEKSIELYQSGLSAIKVKEITNIGICTLYKYLKIQNLTRSNKQNSRKYKVNHEYFSNIDNEEKAYWLGFLFADGYVSKRKKSNQLCVGISLKHTDKAHLEKLRKVLNATYPIKIYTGVTEYGEITYSRLLITSEKMFHDLVSHGMTEHKSLTLKFPQINTNLTHHFIRGYFDGDGSFSKSHDGYKFRLCGTKEFLASTGNIMGFPNRKLQKRHKNKTNNYSLDIGGRLQTITLGNYLYQNASVYLERKYQRYVQLKQHNNSPKL